MRRLHFLLARELTGLRRTKFPKPLLLRWKANVASEPSTSHSAEVDSIAPLEPTEDLEYLQLTFQEAFFLAWALDTLRVLDSSTVRDSHQACVKYVHSWRSER